VVRIADQEGRIVATKDDDFVRSHLLRGEPK
jgi:predicted nuclease of predicted toxin-antitoxin system